MVDARAELITDNDRLGSFVVTIVSFCKNNLQAHKINYFFKTLKLKLH